MTNIKTTNIYDTQREQKSTIRQFFAKYQFPIFRFGIRIGSIVVRIRASNNQFKFQLGGAVRSILVSFFFSSPLLNALKEKEDRKVCSRIKVKLSSVKCVRVLLLSCFLSVHSFSCRWTLFLSINFLVTIKTHKKTFQLWETFFPVLQSTRLIK